MPANPIIQCVNLSEASEFQTPHLVMPPTYLRPAEGVTGIRPNEAATASRTTVR